MEGLLQLDVREVIINVDATGALLFYFEGDGDPTVPGLPSNMQPKAETGEFALNFNDLC